MLSQAKGAGVAAKVSELQGVPEQRENIITKIPHKDIIIYAGLPFIRLDL